MHIYTKQAISHGKHGQLTLDLILFYQWVARLFVPTECTTEQTYIVRHVMNRTLSNWQRLLCDREGFFENIHAVDIEIKYVPAEQKTTCIEQLATLSSRVIAELRLHCRKFYSDNIFGGYYSVKT